MRFIFVLVLSLVLAGCGSSSKNKTEITDLSQLEGIWKNEGNNLVYFFDFDDTIVHRELKLIEDRFDIGVCHTIYAKNDLPKRGVLAYADSGISYHQYANGSTMAHILGDTVKIYLEGDTLTIEDNGTTLYKVTKHQDTDNVDDVLCHFDQRSNAISTLNEMQGLWKRSDTDGRGFLVNSEFIYISNQQINKKLPLFVNYNKSKGCYEGVDDWYNTGAYKFLESNAFEIYYGDSTSRAPVLDHFVISKENETLTFTNLESYTDTYVTPVNNSEINVCSN